MGQDQGQKREPPWKLTYPLKNDGWNPFLGDMLVFRGVSGNALFFQDAQFWDIPISKTNC